MSQSNFEILSLDNVLINENYLKNTKKECTLKTTVYVHIFLYEFH